MLHQGLVALLDRDSPCRLVADLGRARDPRLVTGLAQRLKDLLAGKIAFRAARIRHRDLAERLDARQELAFGFGASRRLHAGDKLRKRDDQSDRYREGEHDDDDQLLVRLDECGLVVAHYEILQARPEGRYREARIIARAYWHRKGTPRSNGLHRKRCVKCTAGARSSVG